MQLSLSDRVFKIIVYIILLVISFCFLYPFWNSLVISFNVGSDTMRGGITFWPRQFTLENYSYVFRDTRLLRSFLISVARTIIGTLLSIFFTAMFGYGMSRKELMGKKIYMILCAITLYFSGGLIPWFLLLRSMGLMNSFWVMIVPYLINVWHMIIFRTFFQGLPEGLEEQASIDGCGYFGTFWRIVLPISKPVIATLALFTAVWHWNQWFDAAIFITKDSLMPLQARLMSIINSSLLQEQLAQMGASAAEYVGRISRVTSKSLIMATTMVAAFPVIIIYPFLHKYFTKGVMLGSIKG